MPPAMISEVTINGTFGEVYDQNGRFLANVQQIDARLTIERQEVRVAGQRQVGYKMKGVSCEGTITQLKVTSDFLKSIASVHQNGRARMQVGELRYRLDDPEALGVEEVRLKRVKFWEIPFGYQINELVEEAIPFTAEGIEIPQAISGDPTTVPPARV